MKIVYSWLCEFLPDLSDHPIGSDPDALAETLSDLGLCCDEVIRVGTDLSGVVTARVLELNPHPDADKIQLVTVDGGSGEGLQVCCGAFNMQVGDVVPLATLGTTMPSGMKIERRKLRGEWSNGMLCSAGELDLSDDAGGIMILAAETELGAPIAEVLGLRPEIVFDLDLTPNRPDALSVLGVARDLSARLGIRLILPDIDYEVSGEPIPLECTPTIQDSDLCGQLHTFVLENIDNLLGDRVVERRLSLCGMRPINPVVDLSNYVMLELGQPNHTYDLDRLPNGVIATRFARDGERLVTLDGQERTLTAGDGVIVDAGDLAIGVAGVMGGASTEVNPSTSRVLLELAWWNPTIVGATAKRLKLRSEASARFERGVDTGIAALAGKRFAALAHRQGARVRPGHLVAVSPSLPDRTEVTLRYAQVERVLGTRLAGEEIRTLLGSLGFESVGSSDTAVVDVPSWRPDVAGEIDIIEEVARLRGYSSFGHRVPSSPRAGRLDDRQRLVRALRHWMVGRGFMEATPMPFLAQGDLEAAGVRNDGVRVANPLAADEAVMRTSLLPGLLKTLGYNSAHRITGAWFVELGHCFAGRPDGQHPLEWEDLAVVAAGQDAGFAVNLLWDLADSFHLSRLELVNATIGGFHPTRSARVLVGEAEIGVVGEVDPVAAGAFGVTERVAALVLRVGGPRAWHGGPGVLEAVDFSPKYVPMSRMPSADMDFAFVVGDEVSALNLIHSARSSSPVVRSVELFDVFRGAGIPEGFRSLAIRVRFQDQSATMDDARLAEERASLIDAVHRETGAVLR